MADVLTGKATGLLSETPGVELTPRPPLHRSCRFHVARGRPTLRHNVVTPGIVWSNLHGGQQLARPRCNVCLRNGREIIHLVLGPNAAPNTRGPSGKTTISPSRSVASANSFGRGFSTSLIGFGVSGFGGGSTLTTGRFVSAGGNRTSSGWRGAGRRAARGGGILGGGTVGSTRWS